MHQLGNTSILGIGPVCGSPQAKYNLAPIVFHRHRGIDVLRIPRLCILLKKLLQVICMLLCRHVIIETNNTTARIFPSVPDCETPEFWCGSPPLDGFSPRSFESFILIQCRQLTVLRLGVRTNTARMMTSTGVIPVNQIVLAK